MGQERPFAVAASRHFRTLARSIMADYATASMMESHSTLYRGHTINIMAVSFHWITGTSNAVQTKV
ncbi:MAG: hypothetical protein FD148_583 [Methylocystaceae bacterium]|nr:MAG: hypothetical protein FD148_583 [Methylocystaceae bacterium]